MIPGFSEFATLTRKETSLSTEAEINYYIYFTIWKVPHSFI